MYKVWTKVLASYFKRVIGKVISNSQSYLVKGRQILDGSLVANEIVDEARPHKNEILLFKVFDKAYDSIEGRYLQFFMGK